MSVNEILKQVEALKPDEQNRVAAFLVHLRHRKDPDHGKRMKERIDNQAEGYWTSLEDLERGQAP